MRILLCCLPLIALGVTGCVLPGKVPDAPVPAVKPEAEAKPPPRQPTVRPVSDKEINETNAWERAKALGQELDREQQPDEVR